MKTALSYEKALEQVEADDMGKWDLLLDPEKSVVAPSFEGGLSGMLLHPLIREQGYENGLSLTDWAKGQVCNRLGIPKAYLERCPSSLQDAQLNYWANSAFKDKEKGFFLRCRENEVRGVLSSRYTPVDNRELLRVTAEMLYRHRLEINYLGMKDQSFHLRICYRETDSDFAPLKGDPYGKGFHICNSEVGFRRVAIMSFLLRLVCTNGLVSWNEESGERGKIHVGHSSEEIYEWFGGFIQKASAEFEATFAALETVKALPIEINEELPKVREDLHLSNERTLNLMQHYAEDDVSPMGTRYRLVNALTRLARDERDSDYRLNLEQYAYRLLNTATGNN